MKDFKMDPLCEQILKEYVSYGRPMGGFLSAVVSNNLEEAVRLADNYNIQHIPAYVHFLYWEAPMECWGSKKNMEKWIEKGGLHGKDPH